MKKLILFWATAGGVGFIPKLPGTLGSLVGILLYLPIRHLHPGPYLITLLALIFFSCWVSTIAEGIFQQKDSQKIVIDEVAGIWVTLALVPFSYLSLLLGFVLFRFFDIWKPFPVRLIQDKVPAGWGVVGDDVMAGVYANLVLQLVMQFR